MQDTSVLEVIDTESNRPQDSIFWQQHCFWQMSYCKKLILSCLQDTHD